MFLPLKVSSLDPSCQTYPDVDWLIGNHSDELTPWIPVIAARFENLLLQMINTVTTITNRSNNVTKRVRN